MKNKKAQLSFIMKYRWIIIVIAFFGLALYFGWISLGAIFDDGNVGNWRISSYNPTTDVIAINYVFDFGLHDNAWFGGKTMNQQGTDLITNQADCERVGWEWIGKDLANQYPCVLYDVNWARDKDVEITGSCHHSGVAGRADETSDRIAGFLGDRISMNANKRGLHDRVVCRGLIIISPIVEEIETPLPTDEDEIPEESPTAQYECIQNIDCIEICGNEIPTCITNDCYCSAIIGEDGLPAIEKLTIIQRINLWIDNLLFKIKEWFGR